MNLLVTGGAGFIGSNFILQLLSPDSTTKVHKLIHLDALTYSGNLNNLKTVAKDPAYKFVKSDIADSTIVSEILTKEQVTAVINFAAESHVDRSIDSAEPFFQTNTLGTLRLVETCRHYLENISESARNTFRFIHISTDEVYGTLNETDAPFTEQSAYAPNNPYAASKASSDFIIRSYIKTYSFPAIITHSSNNYGPFQYPEKLIPLFIRNALEEKPLPLYGTGQNIRDWIHVTDHCQAILAVLNKGKRGERYNIGGNEQHNNSAVAQLICATLDALQPRQKGSSYQELITPVTDRLGHDFRYAMDSTKIQKELGWTPSITFESGLQQTIQWYLNNQEWLKNIKK